MVTVIQKHGVGIERRRSGRHEAGQEFRFLLEQAAELEPVEMSMAGIEGNMILKETQAREDFRAGKFATSLEQGRAVGYGEHLDLILNGKLILRRWTRDHAFVQLAVPDYAWRGEDRQQRFGVQSGLADFIPAIHQAVRICLH